MPFSSVETTTRCQEKGKHLFAPSPWQCFCATKIMKSISGRCDLFHLMLPKPRVARAAMQTASWLGEMRKPTPIWEAGPF